MVLNDAYQEIEQFIRNKFADIRRDLGLPETDFLSHGISFEPNVKLTRIPDEEPVAPGFYQSNDGNVNVEVVKQLSPFQLMLRMPTEHGGHTLESISVRLFRRMFSDQIKFAYVSTATPILDEHNFLQHARSKATTEQDPPALSQPE